MKRSWVYMLQCFDGTYYVGVTSDIDKRIGQHHYGHFENCYTYKRRPLILVHLSEFQRIEDAFAWEKQLKSWSHRKKRAFAQGDWARLKRYSRGTT